MQAPNDYLGAAHRRLLHATSDELQVNAPTDNNAPAQSLQFPLRGPLLPEELPFTLHRAPSPPHEAYSSVGFSNFLDQPWEPGPALSQYTSAYAEHRPPTPPLRNDGYITQTLPPSLAHLPHTRAYLASRPNIFHTNYASIWNTDGSNQQEDWSIPDQKYQAHHGNALFTGRQPQSTGFTSTYQPPCQNFSVPQYTLPLDHYQPRRASSIASSPMLISHNAQPFQMPAQMPAVQQWRTDNLSTRAPTRVSQKLPDESTRRKQEAARRHTIAAGVEAPQQRPLPTPGTKRWLSRQKGSGVDELVASKTKRPKVTPASDTTVPEEWRDARRASVPTPSYDADDGGVMPRRLDYRPSMVEQPWDEIPQPIVSNYEDYKWSVYLYELQPISNYAFAERWLQELFDTTLRAEYDRRHFSHVSHGFIKDGGPLSLLVLHNATNPFEYEPTPTSTTTIGAYGYHWHLHNEIHWTTLGSDQRQLLTECADRGFIAEKHRWRVDADKPTEKRFHRAYWLAANRMDLKNLLNRGVSDDKPLDWIEEKSEDDPDKEFCVAEADLTNEWDVSDAGAAAAWSEILDEVDALGEGGGWQHVEIWRAEG